MIPRTACALSLLFATAAMGQQVLFLKAQAPRLPEGAPVLVHLESPRGPAPWGDVSLLYVLGQDTRENMDRLPGAPDAAGAVALPAPPPGAGAAGVDLAPVIETIDAASLRAFCAPRCAEPLPETVTGKVRLRRIQSCKAMFRIGDAPANSAAALAKAAPNAEIVVRMDPTRAPVGSDIAFSPQMDGDRVQVARVFATPLATGKAQDIVSRKSDPSNFHVTDPGPWRVEFHQLTKAAPGSGADWVLTSATLTFDVPEPKP